MYVKKAHTRCSMAKCGNVRDSYAFFPTRPSGHRPIVLCRECLKGMVEALAAFDKQNKVKIERPKKAKEETTVNEVEQTGQAQTE